MDRGTYEDALLRHAERQTKALESIDRRLQTVMIVLGLLVLVGVVVWLAAVY